MNKICIFIMLVILTAPITISNAAASDYAMYLKRFNSISTISEAKEAGYEIVGIITDYFMTACINGECTVYTAVNRQYGRAAIFFIHANGDVLYKTEDLECNYFFGDSLYQPNADIAAISERDINGDGMNDILLISICLVNGNKFKIGDILFQGKDSFYRDWRISDKINRFGMNMDIGMITAFARDGQSTEFLYRTSDFAELVKGGFEPLTDQTFEMDYEKFGSVKAIPGTYTMGGHHIFMLYLINREGQVVWNFQCMRGYDNFSKMTGISFKDIDGDGWADLSVLADYMTLDDNSATYAVTDFFIYYQRDGYFFEDKDFHASYFKDMTDKEDMEGIILAARKYWGW